MLYRRLLFLVIVLGLLVGGCNPAEAPLPADTPPPAAAPALPAPVPEAADIVADEPPEDDPNPALSFIQEMFAPEPEFPEIPECEGLPVLTAAPVDLDKINEIVTLGNMSPPSHIFPTDHIYFFLTRQEGADRPDMVEVYAPGDMKVIRVRASQHVKAGFADYNIFLRPCRDVILEFFHVSVMNPEMFGDTTDFTSWELDSEYTTGGETYRLWSKDYDIDVKAGDLLGQAGGNPGQWALDLGVYDERHRTEPVAAPERWAEYGYLTALCPLVLYEPGPLLDRMVALVNREKMPDEPLPCGSVLQDVPGTAQGCWFLDGTMETYPEDPHLALVHSNFRPAHAVFSVGMSVADLPSRCYEYLPEDSGRLNRDFKDITPDGNIYGFKLDDFSGMIIITMPDAETLYIEALEEATVDEDSWVFTGRKTTFER